MVILQGSHKYGDATLAAIDAAFGDTFRIVGDETPSSYTPERGASMYGVSYYWSTQDPYGNPESFGQLEEFAGAVRATAPNPDGSRKVWWAPFTPGYDGDLLGGTTCIPREGGETMRTLFKGNAAAQPDGSTLSRGTNMPRAPMSIRCNGMAPLLERAAAGPELVFILLS